MLSMGTLSILAIPPIIVYAQSAEIGGIGIPEIEEVGENWEANLSWTC